MTQHPVQPKQMPSDEVVGQVVKLLIELLQSEQLSDLVAGGAWATLNFCIEGRAAGLGTLSVELGLFDLAVAHLRALGSANITSISRGNTGIIMPLAAVYNVTRALEGHAARSDLVHCVRSGLFEICLEGIVAFAGGVEGLHDANHLMIIMALVIVNVCRGQSGCEAKIRAAATALAFCLEHSLDWMEQLGYTTGAMAARLVCAYFDRLVT
jgi:hypothetical protein